MILKIFKIFFKTIIGIILAVGVYFIGALIFSIITVNKDFQQTENGIPVFIYSNGVHADIVVPVTNEIFDWSTHLPKEQFIPSQKPFEYVAFGWGDKGFYLETPTWDDLKFSTAFKAMFLPTPTAMHVSYRTFPPKTSKSCRKIMISPEQYKILTEYIYSAFQKDQANKFMWINCCHYEGQNDNFYEANGSYHLFKTCNTWTNAGLKKAGIRAALWTPFEWGILYQMDHYIESTNSR